MQVKEKTLAKYTLESPSEVLEFLKKVVAWGESDENAWHKAPACTGWHMRSSLDGRHSSMPFTVLLCLRIRFYARAHFHQTKFFRLGMHALCSMCTGIELAT